MQHYNFSSKLDPNNTEFQWPQPINATAGAIGHFTGGAHRMQGDWLRCHTAPHCTALAARPTWSCMDDAQQPHLPTTCEPQAAAVMGSRTGSSALTAASAAAAMRHPPARLFACPPACLQLCGQAPPAWVAV
jgi:hypothetical protein